MPGEANEEIRWYVTKAAKAQVADVRKMRGEVDYFADVRNLQTFLAGYFDSSNRCSSKLGKSIAPVGAVGNGKVLKVRWTYPGAGKSGGLRLCFVAYCDDRKVVLCHASLRRDVNADELIRSATEADIYLDDDESD